MKTAHDLRTELAKNFHAVRDGSLEINKAEAMSNIAGKMISSAIAQLKQSEINETTSDIAFLREPK